jgi:streptogramin lyase
LFSALVALVLIAAPSAASAVDQDKSPPATSASKAGGNEQKPTVAKGEIVTDLDKAIMHVFQARNGHYWFGSKERGVYRYDGKTLVHFTTKDGLPHNSVGGIQEDKAGNLYFTTSSDYDPLRRRHTQAISRFDGKTFSALTVPDGAPSDSAWKLQPDDLWFGAGQDTGMVYRYDGKTLHPLAFPKTKDGDDHLAKWPRSKFPNARFSPYDTYIIFKDGKGSIWFGTAVLGVCRYDGKSFAWLPETELGNGSFGTRAIAEDKDGRFWFSKTQPYDVDLSDPARPSFRKAEEIEGAGDLARVPCIMSSVLDSAGALWMATYGNGVYRYDGKLTHFPVKDGEKEITLFRISKDNQGVLWLGTHSAGPYKFNGKSFEKFRP